MSTPPTLTETIDLFAGARAELQRFEDAAMAICSHAQMAPARGSVLVAKEALHVARLAVLEAAERARKAVEPRGKGGGWGGG